MKAKAVAAMVAVTLIAAAALVLALPSGTGNEVSCSSTVSAGMGGSTIASVIVGAAGGSTVCLAAGSYPFIHVVGAVHSSYVTVRPVPGASVSVAGMEVQNSSFLRFVGLRMTEGFNMRDTSVGASHDYQFVEDSFEEPLFGIVLDGGSAPIKRVLIERNYMRYVHLDAEHKALCNGGYAQGQDVTMDYAEGVTIAHNTFRQAEWHYIQGGGAGPEGVVVEHNLFEGRIFLACSHLNVWQIWGGGVNDTFASNVVRGEAGKGASVIGLIFENGAGGQECGTTMTNTTVTNNLFVDAAEGYNAMLFTTKGLTYTHNTVVRGTWGQWLDRNTFCGASSNLTIEHNIGVETESIGSPQRFILGECTGTCKFDYNVSDDNTANQWSSTHHLTGWTPSWSTHYTPSDLPFPAGSGSTVGR